MTTSPTILLHVGYPKTATTFLQRRVFAVLPQVRLVVNDDQVGAATNRDLITAITDTETLEWDAGAAQPVWAAAAELASAHERLIVSAEGFSTGSSRPGKVDRRTIAARLQALFPAAQVLVILRRQPDMAQSIYLQRRKQDAGFDRSFAAWFDDEQAWIGRGSILGHLRYTGYLDCLADLFGPERVHVHLFEALQEDPQTLVNRITALLGLEAMPVPSGRENERLTIRQATLRRAGRLPGARILRQALPDVAKQALRDFARSGPAVSVDAAALDLDRLRAIYAADNAVAAARWNLEMQRYGYPLPSGA